MVSNLIIAPAFSFLTMFLVFKFLLTKEDRITETGVLLIVFTMLLSFIGALKFKEKGKNFHTIMGVIVALVTLLGVMSYIFIFPPSM